MAFARVGVALVQGVARHAMKAHQQFFAPAVLTPMRLHLGGQRGDIGRVVVVMTHGAHFRHIAQFHQRGKGGVQRAAAAAGGVLRIQRQQQQALHALGAQLLHALLDRGLAVAHGELHHHVFTGQPAGQAFRLAAGVDQQRRALRRPDRGVFLGGFARADIQNHAVQNQRPQPARQLDHAAVRQKLLQVGAQRARGGRGRGAQVDQQHAQAGRAVVSKTGFRQKSRHQDSASSFSKKPGTLETRPAPEVPGGPHSARGQPPARERHRWIKPARRGRWRTCGTTGCARPGLPDASSSARCGTPARGAAS